MTVDRRTPTGGTPQRLAVLSDVPERLEDSLPPYPVVLSVGQTADGAFLFLWKNYAQANRCQPLTSTAGRVVPTRPGHGIRFTAET